MKLKIGQGVDGKTVVVGYLNERPFRLTGPGVDVKLRCAALGRGWEGRTAFVDLEFEQVGPTIAELIKEGYLPPLKASKWNGEGLPPVGLDVEVLFHSIGAVYVTAKVIAHDENRAVYRFTSGNRKGEHDSEIAGLFNGRLPFFRPIRTPEQIAAEEREKAIREMNKVARAGSTTYVASTGLGGGCEALYDAGYRKFEIVDEKP